MPGLAHSLRGEDLGRLQIIADFWGVDFKAKDVKEGLDILVEIIASPETIQDAFEALSSKEQEALGEIASNQGKISYPVFSRKYGMIEEVGPARRDRDKPYLDPDISIAERLWYRGWIARGFFDTPDGPLEFIYIPDEFLPFIPPGSKKASAIILDAVHPDAIKRIKQRNDNILEDITSILAALRRGDSLGDAGSYLLVEGESVPEYMNFLNGLLLGMQLIGESGVAIDRVREFLEISRREAIQQVYTSWLNCLEINELNLLSTVRVEGEQALDPLRPRDFLVQCLSDLSSLYSPSGESEPLWWNLEQFIQNVHQSHPDFLRPEGDYDSWHIRQISSDEFLNGFEHWYDVEGELLRFMFLGPLFWLGVVDLGFTTENVQPEEVSASQVCFRVSRIGLGLLGGKPMVDLTETSETISVKSNGTIVVPFRYKRHIHYQIARMSSWLIVGRSGFHYRITPSSLEKARNQGLEVRQIIQLLKTEAKVFPPSYIQALERWDRQGDVVLMRNVEVMQVSREEILENLLRSPAKRFILQVLNPRMAIVKKGAKQKLLDLVYEKGWLGESVEENDEKISPV